MTEREKIIYDILCSDEQPPEGQHWEEFVTNKIVAALAQPEPWVKTYSGGKPNYTEPCERCGEVNPAEIHTCTPKQPFEYWNAVEGWVKIEEVRQHFDTAGCGTIYKTGGEGRVPLYAAREWQRLTDEEIKDHWITCMWKIEGTALPIPEFARAIEDKLKKKNSTSEKNIQTSDKNESAF